MTSELRRLGIFTYCVLQNITRLPACRLTMAAIVATALWHFFLGFQYVGIKRGGGGGGGGGGGAQGKAPFSGLRGSAAPVPQNRSIGLKSKLDHLLQ